MLASVVPAAFEDVEEPDDITIGIGVRVEQRMADAGLRRQVDDGIKAVGDKQFGNRRAIGDIALLEMEVRMSSEFGQAGFFQLRVIVGIEVVERDHGAAVGQQTSRHMKTDEAGRASDQNRLHHSSPSPASVRLSGDNRVRPQQAQSSAIAPTI